MPNITLALDDETYRRARIRAAEQDTSISGYVKQLLTANVQVSPVRQADGQPSPSVLELAAELRDLTAGRRQTPSEVLQREGRDER